MSEQAVPLVRLTVTNTPPPSKKNSEKIVMIGRRPSIRTSSQYDRATKEAVRQITKQLWDSVSGEAETIDFPVQMKVIFHVLCTSDNPNRPDLPNLLHAPADWLEPPKVNKHGMVTTPGASVIENDNLICSVDGSRRVFECDGCPDRKSGCNYRFETRLKKDGTPRLDRKGKPVRIKRQVCERGGLEIELWSMG